MYQIDLHIAIIVSNPKCYVVILPLKTLLLCYKLNKIKGNINVNFMLYNFFIYCGFKIILRISESEKNRIMEIQQKQSIESFNKVSDETLYEIVEKLKNIKVKEYLAILYLIIEEIQNQG
jgi:hypothetical protein